MNPTSPLGAGGLAVYPSLIPSSPSGRGLPLPPTPFPGVRAAVPRGAGSGAAETQPLCSHFFAHPCALLFCIVFSMPSLIASGPILAPKIDQKSIQNRSKMGVKRDAKNHNEKSRISQPFWDDFSSIFDQFSRRSLKSSASLFKAFLQSCQIKQIQKKHTVLPVSYTHLRAHET